MPGIAIRCPICKGRKTISEKCTYCVGKQEDFFCEHCRGTKIVHKTCMNCFGQGRIEDDSAD